MLAFATLCIGHHDGKKAGRIELWLEQKEILGLEDGDAIGFPSGAIMYANGRIERIYRQEASNPALQGQCKECHKNRHS
jgi:hypothetical protein